MRERKLLRQRRSKLSLTDYKQVIRRSHNMLCGCTCTPLSTECNLQKPLLTAYAAMHTPHLPERHVNPGGKRSAASNPANPLQPVPIGCS